MGVKCLIPFSVYRYYMIRDESMKIMCHYFTFSSYERPSFTDVVDKTGQRSQSTYLSGLFYCKKKFY